MPRASYTILMANKTTLASLYIPYFNTRICCSSEDFYFIKKITTEHTTP